MIPGSTFRASAGNAGNGRSAPPWYRSRLAFDFTPHARATHAGTRRSDRSLARPAIHLDIDEALPLSRPYLGALRVLVPGARDRPPCRLW